MSIIGDSKAALALSMGKDKIGDARYSIVVAAMVIASNIEALARRVDMLTRPRPRSRRGQERRRNPRACTLCGGPMRPDRRPPRDVRGPNGQIRRLPEEVLSWFKCGRCHGSQIGVKP